MRTWQVRVKINPQSYGVEESVFFVLREHGNETNFYLKSPLDAGSSSPQDWAAHHILRDHEYSVTCLAWSLDDTILLTSAEHFIKLWNTKVNTLYRLYLIKHSRQILKTGVCIRTLEDHTETVTAISWLPDGSGFISGGLDRKIIIWVSQT